LIGVRFKSGIRLSQKQAYRSQARPGSRSVKHQAINHPNDLG
jgi:hypothetical protein